MMDAAEVSGILDAVYELAVFPDRWPQALETGTGFRLQTASR